jgi:type IV secretory pathway VirB2 component (pilin)
LSNRTKIVLAVAALAIVALPHFAFAAAVAGGGMPYSNFLGTFKTSITGEIAAIICVVAIVAGVATYIFASAFDGILLTIVRVAIGTAIIGSAVTMLTTMGVTGAIV